MSQTLQGEPGALAPGPSRLRLAMRLTRLALGASVVALLVAGSVLNGYMFWLARDALVADHTALADVLAGNVVAALQFGDERVATETLATLQAAPQVVQARLVDERGQPFASFGAARRPASIAELPAPVAVRRHDFVDGMLVLSQPVVQGDRVIGRIELVVSMQSLNRQAALFAGITVLAALVALGIAYGLAVGVRRDVDQVESTMHALAYVDPVTGLPNRHAAGAALREAVARYRAGDGAGAGFALMVLDLDDFKDVNDTLGHPAGDAVLQALARRLRARLPAGAQAFRFGGDEFIVLAGANAELGEWIMRALLAPIDVEGHVIHVRCSAGLASFPRDADDEHGLLRAADTAMYHAKSRGKNAFESFRPALLAAAQHRLTVETELRRALAEGELRLHYQPIVELATQRPVGAEALVRWQHPERGLIGPGEFIAVAESSGLIVELGGWVLGEAARQLQRWQQEGLDGIFVAVNVSARQLRDGELLRQLDRALVHAPSVAARLEIEITEHSVVEDAQENVATLLALRQRGLRVAIDDFGTGLSSLAYLKHLPVDKVKIDRSFVRELPANQGDLAIVRAAISMADALDLQVVAEGVEEAGQHDVLLAQGCHYGQGWRYGRPCSAEAFATLVDALRRAAGEAAVRTTLAVVPPLRRPTQT